MITITYKNIESSPQYTAILLDWDFYPRTADSFFTFVPPEGAAKVDFLTNEKLKELLEKKSKE